MKVVAEAARDVPVIGEYDVVVCGGGPAGCAAAVAAGRAGARVLLMEKDGYLGGATVSQLVVVILSTNGVDFQGIWHEYARELIERGGIRELECRQRGKTHQQIRGGVDPELVKYVWDDLCSRAGVEFLHHAHGSTLIVEDGTARGVIAETKAGRRAILAKRVIDATGDGYVAAQAGVGFDVGDGEHPWPMAMTKVLRLGRTPPTDKMPDKAAMDIAAQRLAEAVERGEYDAPVVTEQRRLIGYLRAGVWNLPENRHEWITVISRVLKVDPLDPFDMTRAEREGREQARQAADFCCRHVPGFENAYMLDTSAHIGIRSSRRLHGIATVTDDDACSLRKFPDGIARSSWDIDVWPADSYTRPAVPRQEGEYQARMDKVVAGDYFDIPYGALVAKGIDNVLMAGRCVSAGHRAEASLRIQQTCMATGQAAGTAAALSLEQNVAARELDTVPLLAKLEEDRDIEPAFGWLKEMPLAGG